MSQRVKEFKIMCACGMLYSLKEDPTAKEDCKSLESYLKHISGRSKKLKNFTKASKILEAKLRKKAKNGTKIYA
jgi:hypothetical protein